MPSRIRKQRRKTRKMRGGLVPDSQYKGVPFFIEHTEKEGPRVISGVPLILYQSWVTNAMPPKMIECMNTLLEKNPEFDHYLYSHERCLKFIKDNYSVDVAHAYRSLKPGAYKSDLWRYCILYKRGGVYLDVKFYTTTPIISLIESHPELFIKDTIAEGTNDDNLKCKTGPGIYNGFIISPPENPIFKECIDDIVKSCKKRRYKNGMLGITGPCLLGHSVKRHRGDTYIEDIPFTFIGVNENGVQMGNIKKGNKTIVKQYPEYRDELSGSKVDHYTNMWRRKNIYQGGTKKQRGGANDKIVFTLKNTTGFGSMAHFLTQAYIHAKKNGKEFYIENSGWHYGNWHDYFKSLKTLNASDTSPITRYMHASKIENSSIQEHNNAIKEIFVPIDAIVAAAEKFKQEFGAPYYAIYVRRGDKTSGNGMENPPADLKPLLETTDIKAGDNLFVMTDDYAVVEEIRRLLPKVKIFTMTPPENNGASIHILKGISPEKMKEHANELFTSIQVFLGCKRGWVENRSNLGRFLKLAAPDTLTLYPSDSNNSNIPSTTIIDPGFKSLSA
jgi:hypothetical protein